MSENCFACGRPMEKIREMPRHSPVPASESERCSSRPRKYANLQCMYAAGHECAHTAAVSGTGRHFWRDEDAA